MQDVKPQKFEMPRDPESLMALVNATRGALRELTGLDDPEEARLLLRKQVFESREREVEKKRQEAAEFEARRWRSEPVDSPPASEASESIRTLSGGLPTLGRRRR
ncbi:hypothetical protein ACFQMH_25955 [Streptomyces viridiviolaceus]|uniref:Uncharacterized protein n=1 Tax=Streptomyces viridiviolaceus TaxID=68282 RepID=A0ABW2E8E5_9ACTN|nr:hypothetical protein [Streptomyces viridiviolaceus]